MKLNYLLPSLVAAGTAIVAASSFSPATAFTITAEAAGVTTPQFSNAVLNTFTPNNIAPFSYTGGNVVSGSVTNSYAQPFLPASDYLTVANGYPTQSSPTLSPTPATLTLSGGLYQKLGLFWGSIDSLNSISFYQGGSLIAGGTFNGTNLVAAGLGLLANGATTTSALSAYNAGNRYITFSATNSGEYFDEVRFNSGKIAFESDNHAVQAVPEPLTIIGSAIALGFGANLKRKFAKTSKNNSQKS